MPIKLTNEQFIQKAIEAHGDLYSYELVEYTNYQTKVKIICQEHGEFLQSPSNHLSGQGCSSCSNEALASKAKSKSEFDTRASITHKNKYDYSLVDYQGAYTKVSIICPLHGSFKQTPKNHLHGKSGCPVCALEESGWTRTKFKDKCIKNNNGLGILYILGCWDDNKKETFIKIGITSNSIKKRYCSKAKMPYNYKVLHEITGSPEYIYNLETLLHRKSCNYRYIPITSFGGSSTECFLADKDYLEKLNNHIFNLIPF